MAKRRKSTEIVPKPEPGYGSLLTAISDLLDQARRMSARTVNNILTATYWEIGRRIVEFEQGGKARAKLPPDMGGGSEISPTPSAISTVEAIATTQHALETRAAMKGPDHG